MRFFIGELLSDLDHKRCIRPGGSVRGCPPSAYQAGRITCCSPRARERLGFLPGKAGPSCFSLALSGAGHGPPFAGTLGVSETNNGAEGWRNLERRLRLIGGTRF